MIFIQGGKFMSKFKDKQRENAEIDRQMKKIKGLNTLMFIIVVCIIILFALVYLSQYLL